MTHERLKKERDPDAFCRLFYSTRKGPGGPTVDEAVFASITGVTTTVFKNVFNKYCRSPATGDRTRDAGRMSTPFALYGMLLFLKVNPVARMLGVLLGDVGKSPTHLYADMKRRVRWLGLRIDELSVQNYDRLPHGMFSTTGGSVDGFPVYVTCPKDPASAKKLYSGKYNSSCVKFDVGASHSGVPLFLNGPYPGTMHDAAMWNGRPNPMPPGVDLLGDSGYYGCPGVFPARKRPAGKDLTEDELFYNRVLQWWRATTEHVIGYIKRFAIVGGRYRGRIDTIQGSEQLYLSVKVCTHLSAIHIRDSAKRRLTHSVNLLGQYLLHLSIKGSFESRYDVARKATRDKRLSGYDRAIKEGDADYVDPSEEGQELAMESAGYDARAVVLRVPRGNRGDDDSDSDDDGRGDDGKQLVGGGVRRARARGPAVNYSELSPPRDAYGGGSDDEQLLIGLALSESLV